MMNSRHEKLGIKQTIQKSWMDYTVNLMLSGLTEKEIRLELDAFLSSQRQSGGIGERGKDTYPMAISVLASWFSPDKELKHFRDHAFDLIRNVNPEYWLPFHWAVISASYPFWFNVAKQAGRLLNLQEKITKSQVMYRLKESYGDRITVERNMRYVMRSFVAWGVLKDSHRKGCYELDKKMEIKDRNHTILLYESALHANKEGKLDLLLVKNNPAYFPFKLPLLTGEYISQNCDSIDSIQNGMNNELLKLKCVPKFA